MKLGTFSESWINLFQKIEFFDPPKIQEILAGKDYHEIFWIIEKSQVTLFDKKQN